MSPSARFLAELPETIKRWSRELGFADVAFAHLDLVADTAHLQRWVAAGRAGSMAYMARNADLRADPAALRPGTASVIAARMDYWPDAEPAQQVLADGTRGYVARYALGRDYHKLMRKRLRQLAAKVAESAGPFGFRVFSDSAPILEKALARNAGLGWIGKHTLVLNRRAGSYFLLGEIFTDLPLQPSAPPPRNHCGSCQACLDVCPTQAIVAPYTLDARRCISYLTIENRGPIPEPLRAAIGNRIFGCDDCQLVCPWNRRAKVTPIADFQPRHGLDGAALTELFGWSEDEWLRRTEGMALRRATYRGWLRNVAVALGNAPRADAVREALAARAEHPDEMVREHVQWALERQAQRPRQATARGA